MDTENFNAKKEILAGLVVSDEVLFDDLKKIVKQMSTVVKITAGGKIYFEAGRKLNNREKIFLYLAAAHFAEELKLRESGVVHITELENELGAKQTTLSAPIKALVDENIIFRVSGDEKGKYKICVPKIKEFVEGLIQRS